MKYRVTVKCYKCKWRGQRIPYMLTKRRYPLSCPKCGHQVQER